MPALRTRAARVLRVFCPVEAKTLERLLCGDTAAMVQDPTLAALLDIVRSDNPLGDFGSYRSVMEIAPGWELFTPGARASPTLGKADAAAVSPTVILTIHVPADAPEATFDAAVRRILEAHPWEVPVIEVSETRLIERG